MIYGIEGYFCAPDKIRFQFEETYEIILARNGGFSGEGGREDMTLSSMATWEYIINTGMGVLWHSSLLL